MQNVKRSMGMLCAIAMFVCLLFVPVQKAEAATAGMTTLKVNKTYTSYDITGDGKKYLWVRGQSDNNDDPFQALYKYSSGQMKKALDFSSKIKNFGNHTGTIVTKVSGNKIYVEQFLMSAPLGSVGFNYTYEYKSGSFSRTSNTASIKYVSCLNGGYGTLKKSKILYTSSSCTKKYKTLAKSTKVKPLKIYMNGTTISVYVKTKSGSTGWLKCSRSFSNGTLLKECYYAG